jgi:hypothetical protein
VLAIRTHLTRTGRTWIDPDRIRTRPAAVLASILRQLDPEADNPALAPDLDDQADALEPCGRPDCDGHGWIELPSAHSSDGVLAPCPDCPPSIRTWRPRPDDVLAGGYNSEPLF